MSRAKTTFSELVRADETVLIPTDNKKVQIVIHMTHFLLLLLLILEFVLILCLNREINVTQPFQSFQDICQKSVFFHI